MKSRREASGTAERDASATDLLLDTDVCIDHLRGASELAISLEGAAYSVVTRCELYAGHASDEGRVERLLRPLTELPFDRAVAERAGRLRRQLHLDLPDAVIAATALTHGRVLVTRNRRDFERVPDLRLQDPADIA